MILPMEPMSLQAGKKADIEFGFDSITGNKPVWFCPLALWDRGGASISEIAAKASVSVSLG